MSHLKSTLIISTYNFPKALRLVLKSLKHQTIFPDEVIIADDGSTKDTKILIESFVKTFDISLHHVWHNDVGFTKATILNKAIAKASGDYIIQLDGDCIMHKNFIKNHITFAAKEQYLYGSRVNIQKGYLSTLFSKEQINFNAFSKGIKKRTRALYIPILSILFRSKNTYSKKYRGCNTSFFKSDFIAVNGYNEDFKGWGREDSELAIRFYNYGLKARRLRYAGIVYHIFHFEKPKNKLELNNTIEQKTLNEKLIYTNNGINKHLK